MDKIIFKQSLKRLILLLSFSNMKDDMRLSLRQYNILMHGRKKVPGLFGTVMKYAGLWDISMHGQDKKYLWGLCYSVQSCYGVPYKISSAFTPWQKIEIEKAMREIELATCIR